MRSTKRFQTTAATAMQDVAERIARGETDSRETVGRDLARRKLENTKTSIVLGSDVNTYRTDAMDTQMNILMEGGGAIQVDGKVRRL